MDARPAPLLNLTAGPPALEAPSEPMPPCTIVTRLLWPGVGRMAIEEARRLPADLLVLRESAKPVQYDLRDLRLRYLRRRGARGLLTPIFRKITLTYNPGRGEDATVDLDLIARASSEVAGPALYHDQFAGLSGLVRRLRSGAEYALYLHETALGDTPGVMTTRSPLADYAVRRFDRTVLDRASLVLTNSRSNQQLLSDYGIPSEVLYPGCDPQPSVPTDREPMVLATSVWEPTRRMEFYVDLARATRARVVLAGTWARPEELAAFRRRYGDLLDITGPISEAELIDLSRRASVYVRFGFGERGPGQGGIQALAYGLPVISNRGLPMTELIDPGENGFVVDTAREAAECVDRILGDPALRNRMSEAALARSRELSWSNHALRLRTLLNRTAMGSDR